MILTDKDIDVALTCAKQELAKKISPSMPMTSIETCLDRNTLLRDYFARAVIAANNEKVLADLQPLMLVTGEDSCGRACMVTPLLHVYSAAQVSALIQRNEALEAWLEADATCPCCGESVQCLDGCTFATDAPHDYDKMQEVRNVLKATS